MTHLALGAEPIFFSVGVNQSPTISMDVRRHMGPNGIIYRLFLFQRGRLLAGGFNIPLCTIWTLSSSTKKSESKSYKLLSRTLITAYYLSPHPTTPLPFSIDDLRAQEAVQDLQGPQEALRGCPSRRRAQACGRVRSS